MQITIDSFSDLKQTDRGPSAKIKAGNESFYVNEDPTNLVGKTVEIEVTEKTSAKGNKYRIAKITKVLEKAGGSNGAGGGITWEEYRTMAQLAHALAATLEPDALETNQGEGPSVVNVDRSTARAAILNTVMIAFSNGKIAAPEADDEEMPF